MRLPRALGGEEIGQPQAPPGCRSRAPQQRLRAPQGCPLRARQHAAGRLKAAEARRRFLQMSSAATTLERTWSNDADQRSRACPATLRECARCITLDLSRQADSRCSAFPCDDDEPGRKRMRTDTLQASALGVRRSAEVGGASMLRMPSIYLHHGGVLPSFDIMRERLLNARTPPTKDVASSLHRTPPSAGQPREAWIHPCRAQSAGGIGRWRAQRGKLGAGLESGGVGVAWG